MFRILRPYAKETKVSSNLLAIDQGTTSTRAIVVDEKGRIKASAQSEFEQV